MKTNRKRPAQHARPKAHNYENQQKAHTNFTNKRFTDIQGYNTDFSGSDFSNTSFYRSVLKYCTFDSCLFRFTDFTKTNFTQSSFKNAIFENCLFDQCVLSGCDFENAIFTNTYAVKTEVPAPVINADQKKIHIDLIPALQSALSACRNNPAIIRSKTLFVQKPAKGKKEVLSKQGRKKVQREKLEKQFSSDRPLEINRINVARLVHAFGQEKTALALKEAAKKMDRDFVSLSAFLPYFK